MHNNSLKRILIRMEWIKWEQNSAHRRDKNVGNGGYLFFLATLEVAVDRGFSDA